MNTPFRPFDIALVMRAADFAAERHSRQRRKGPDHEPYVNHLLEVAHLLAGSASGQDPRLIAAGLLHDTIEDTATTYDDLVRAFDRDIADIVMEVTDDKLLRKDERKRLQVESITRKSRRAQLVVIADKTANLGSLVRGAPPDWTRGRIVEYGAWAERVVIQVRSVDSFLIQAFDDALEHLKSRHQL